MDLTLEVRTENDTPILEVGGEVDIYTAPKLREKLVELIDGGSDRIVVDLEQVGFMDSTGLGSLVAGLKRIRERDGELAIVCTREPILKVLAITGLDRVFPVHDSVGNALG
ncbi:MAG TPA: STAS domain-containing protein [Actinomycetota bacterium]